MALTRLVRRGLIERVRDGRLVHYRVTERADRLLAEGDGRIFSLGDPRDDEGTWTVLWHQIPEDRRLERTPPRPAAAVPRLRLGPGQRLGLAPRPLRRGRQAARRAARVDHATLFTAHPDAVVGLPALVSRAWDLSGLVERYEAFVAEFSPLCHRRALASLSDRDAFFVRTRLVHQFRGFPMIDPELPDDWPRSPVRAAARRASSTSSTWPRRLLPAPLRRGHRRVRRGRLTALVRQRARTSS